MDIDDILAEALHVSAPQETLDLQELTRAWVAERVAPELLPYPDALMERVLTRIRRQIETVEEQTGNMDPKTNFKLIVIQTELERFKFLVRSFLRARVAKIDKYPLHVQQNSAEYLSPSESQYLTAHQNLLASHYQSSFLSQFPNSLQKLDDTQGGISMIDAPDPDTAVFCRALRDVGEINVVGTDRAFEMKRGDVRVVRWSAIREKVLAGDIELV
ncbi:GINS complex, Sld5 component [Mytilinidion resinicola]|uniref:DNA replication complex GINS protein SLD5 n=1 Tax=Mytilinidion resinicola TaxID=574789 RepID=A0A6A6YHG9_9PEZI|nr:GINS complex, Sld5 component [Mytilinidion resinicola]KAF2808039.1 GINS complex, Sld5 component [Mytilinidion resinicola]